MCRQLLLLALPVWQVHFELDADSPRRWAGRDADRSNRGNSITVFEQCEGGASCQCEEACLEGLEEAQRGGADGAQGGLGQGGQEEPEEVQPPAGHRGHLRRLHRLHPLPQCTLQRNSVASGQASTHEGAAGGNKEQPCGDARVGSCKNLSRPEPDQGRSDQPQTRC